MATCPLADLAVVDDLSSRIGRYWFKAGRIAGAQA